MAKIKEHWVKITPYGNYRETLDRLFFRTNDQTMIIREARKLMVVGKHAGSKPIYRLLNGIAKAHESMKK